MVVVGFSGGDPDRHTDASLVWGLVEVAVWVWRSGEKGGEVDEVSAQL